MSPETAAHSSKLCCALGNRGYVEVRGNSALLVQVIHDAGEVRCASREMVW